MASSMPLQRAAAIGLRIPTAGASRQSSLQSQTTLMRRLLLRPSRPSNCIQRRPNSTQSTSSSSTNSTTTKAPPAAGTTPASTSSSTAAAAEQASAKTVSRFDRILHRTSRYLPERLRAPLRGFRKAPVSHVASFLVLHELTAIIPLFGLTGVFYYLDIVPVEWVFGWWAPYVQDEGTKVLRYFKKKGWFGLAAGDARGEKEDMEKGEERLERELAEREEGKKKGWFAFLRKGGKGDKDEGEVEEAAKSKARKAIEAARTVKGKVTWDNSEMGYKLGVQIVAAYAITKMFLIPRVAFSLWLTPSFARAMVWSRKLIFRR
ncbi:hypothetical protein PG996_008095 [Apiospora saccharicola]|uniref:Mitochondrial seryl-tRNA synthetase n=1 Tax=Apiospora saccharicola TaxID=335842 RepID=A0ABR1UWX9_9PEZI